MSEQEASASGKSVQFVIHDENEEKKIGEGTAEEGDGDVESGQEQSSVVTTGTVDLSGSIDSIMDMEEGSSSAGMGIIQVPQSQEIAQPRERSVSRSRRLAGILRSHGGRAVVDQQNDSEWSWKWACGIVGVMVFLLWIYLFYYFK